ncbi:MAG: TlpA disulfide reductase family protein [Thiolinea sp.]
MTTIDGQTIELQELRGAPYMVVFWATSCSGCVKEIPELNALHDEMKARGFKVIAIAMSYDELPLIQNMRQQKNMNYDIVFDKDGTLAEAFGGIMVTPTNFLISPEGKIALQKMGEFDPEEMRGLLDNLLKG